MDHTHGKGREQGAGGSGCARALAALAPWPAGCSLRGAGTDRSRRSRGGRAGGTEDRMTEQKRLPKGGLSPSLLRCPWPDGAARGNPTASALLGAKRPTEIPKGVAVARYPAYRR